MSKPSWLDDEENQSKVGSVAAKVVTSPAAKKSFFAGLTPSWSESPREPVQVKATPVATPAPTPSAAAVAGDPPEFLGSAEELAAMNRWKYILSFFYIAAAANLGAAAGLSLVLQTNVSLIFFAVYVLIFSLIICCFEVAFGVSLLLKSNYY